jgi:hypothetical protein
MHSSLKNPRAHLAPVLLLIASLSLLQSRASAEIKVSAGGALGRFLLVRFSLVSAGENVR